MKHGTGWAAAVFLTLPLAAPALADEDARAKADGCLVCHGADGRPASDAIPSLAGQPAQYVATQLYLYREGSRANDSMKAIAAGLSNADMNALGAIFAAAPPPAPGSGADAATVERAQALIAANHCGSCHGPALAGVQQIPRLAGQQKIYLAAALRAYKAGTRSGVDGTMGSAAEPLSDSDIDTLADYLAGLGAPQP